MLAIGLMTKEVYLTHSVPPAQTSNIEAEEVEINEDDKTYALSRYLLSIKRILYTMNLRIPLTRLHTNATNMASVALNFNNSDFAIQGVNNINEIATELSSLTTRLRDISLNTRGGSQHQSRY
jgi:signal transduction histidine kinase